MLVSLKIKNIALIDEVKIEFSEGFNVLTGETGAGKSIVVDALNFVLGAKANKTLINANSDFAYVEGVLEIDKDNDELLDIFNDFSIECDDYVKIQRTMTVKGKNECRINGEIVTLAMLKRLTVKLVDIFGQHDHQLLLDIKNHLKMLDAISEKNIDTLKNNLATKLLELKSINEKIAQLGGDDDERAREIELLEFEINQIEQAELSEKEEEELLKNKLVLQNSEKIFQHVRECNQTFYNADLLNAVKTAVNELNKVELFDATLQKNAQKLLDLRYQLEEVVLDLQDFERGIYYSDNEVNKIDDRLHFIKDLKRKFGRTIPDILEYLERAKEKKFTLENCQEELDKLHNQKHLVLKSVFSIAENLSLERKKIAAKLEGDLVAELQELGIKNARFKVDFADDYSMENIESKITKSGADRVEFLFSANLGQPLKPLKEIISGGEMSRLMLAFKCIVQYNEPFKTFIFDEIDTGIGGAIGMVLAKKLANISRMNQVICVTHLSQIAVFADYQFKIIKKEHNEITKTIVTRLTNSERVEELTRMIGTMENQHFAQMHANELIKESATYKQSLL